MFKCTLVANLISMIANIIKLVLMTETILAGRLLFGIGVGIGNVCLSKVLNDSIPNEYS